MISELLPSSSKDFSLVFPHRRQESWKYLDLQALEGMNWNLTSSPELSSKDLTSIEDLKIPGAIHIVFCNGFYQPELSSIEEIEGLRLTQEKKPFSDKGRDNYFSALSSLLSDSIFSIHVESGVEIELPLQIIDWSFLSEGLVKNQGFFSPQHIQIQLESNSQLKILSTFPENDNGFVLRSQLIDVLVSSEAELHLCQCHKGSKGSNKELNFYSMNHIRVQQEEKSSFFFVGADLQNQFVRNEIEVSVNGSFCETSVDGFYMSRDQQVVDNHTVIDQKSPHCQTHQLYKGILVDNSHGIFDGKIIIRKDSQKIEAEQLNNNLLIGSKARVDTKPNLEIFADDVKASHGATIGQLEEQELFYLQSRGISHQEALRMVSFGFLADVSYRIKDKKIRAFVEQSLKEFF